jgi:hypothetical protein
MKTKIKNLHEAVDAFAERKGDYLVGLDFAVGDVEEALVLRGDKDKLVQLLNTALETAEIGQGDALALFDDALEQLDNLG